MTKYTNQDLSRRILAYYDPAIKIGNGEIYQHIANWVGSRPEETNVYDGIMRFKKPLINAGGKVMRIQRLWTIINRATTSIPVESLGLEKKIES